MKIKVGINGFGRIGRLVTRAIFLNKFDEIEIVAINDLHSIENMKYLFNYDTVHGIWNNSNNKVDIINDKLVINNNSIKIFQERDPKNIKWDDLNVDYVIECTGVFTNIDKASQHLVNNKNIKSIIISAPSEDAPMYVMGVNENNYRGEKVISNASCTTNCLGPLVKILNDNFKIREGLMSTIHATTATQKTVDGPSVKDWRGGRSIFNNIIPSSTGAAKAIGKIIPELEGKLTGLAYRVPVSDGSIVDLTVSFENETSLEKIEDAIKNSIQMKNGLVNITYDEIVSSDIIGNKASSIFDLKASIMLNNKFFKIVSWYDNEWGYSNRLVDLITNISRK